LIAAHPNNVNAKLQQILLYASFLGEGNDPRNGTIVIRYKSRLFRPDHRKTGEDNAFHHRHRSRGLRARARIVEHPGSGTASRRDERGTVGGRRASRALYAVNGGPVEGQFFQSYRTRPERKLFRTRSQLCGSKPGKFCAKSWVVGVAR
jgi:hypothetical protein